MGLQTTETGQANLPDLLVGGVRNPSARENDGFSG